MDVKKKLDLGSTQKELFHCKNLVLRDIGIGKNKKKWLTYRNKYLWKHLNLESLSIIDALDKKNIDKC